MRLYRFWLAVVGIFLASAVSGQGHIQWTLGEDESLIDEARTLQGLESKQGKSGLMQLVYRTRISIRENSTTERVQLIYFYADDDAVIKTGTNTVSWNPADQDIRFLEAMVIHSDGNQTRLDPSTVKVLDTDSYDVFTDQRDVVLHLPRLAPGSVSILSFKRTISNAQPYYFSTYLQSDWPRRLFEVEIDWENQAPAWHLDGGMVTCEESTQRILCRGENLPKAHVDNEVNYPDVLPFLTVSGSASWDQVINTMLPKIEKAMANSKQFGALFESLTKREKSMEAALEFVSRKIRYVSRSDGENALFPHHIDETIKNRYGDCKDKSTLLLALLRRFGYAVYPVLVATDRANAERLRVPGTGYFDHMVLCMNPGAGEHCFDPTDAYTDVRTIPRGIQGKVRLNLVPGSVPSSIPMADFRWRLTVTNDLQFQDSGGQIESLARQYHGEFGSWMRSQLGGLNEEERIKWLTDNYHQTVTASVAVKFDLTDTNSLTQEFNLKSTATFDPFHEPSDPFNYSDYPFWLRWLINNFKNKNERYDYFFPGIHVRGKYRYHLADLWALKGTGPKLDYNSEYGTMTRTYEKAEGRVVVMTEVKMPAAIISQAKKDEFNRFLKLVNADSVIRIWGNPRETE